MTSRTDVLVVGAGLGGLRVCETLRDLEFSGSIALVGAEAYPPYDRPPLSKTLLKHAGDLPVLRDPSSFAGLGIDFVGGTRARELRAQAREVGFDDGSVRAYDHLVIATGAEPRVPMDVDRLAGVHVLRSFDDAHCLRTEIEAARHLVIIGAGVIGCEVAWIARELGVAVDLVDVQPLPMMRSVPLDFGEEIARWHRASGTELRLGVGVRRLRDKDGAVSAVELSDGTTLECNVVLVATGVLPTVDWLAGSEIDLRDGVVTDACGRTSFENVYAVGDAASWWDNRTETHQRHEHWTSADEQARHVAQRILQGEACPPAALLPYFWSQQCGRRIQTIGWPGSATEALRLDVGPEPEQYVWVSLMADRVSAATAVNLPRLLPKMRELVRSRATRSHASEVILAQRTH